MNCVIYDDLLFYCLTLFYSLKWRKRPDWYNYGDCSKILTELLMEWNQWIKYHKNQSWGSQEKANVKDSPGIHPKGRKLRKFTLMNAIGRKELYEVLWFWVTLADSLFHCRQFHNIEHNKFSNQRCICINRKFTDRNLLFYLQWITHRYCFFQSYIFLSL